MSEKPSGVAAAQAAATDIGLAMQTTGYVCPWGGDDWKAMDADEHATRSILSRCFSLGRRHRWSPQEFAECIERKREKINALVDKYKEQAEKGRQTL